MISPLQFQALVDEIITACPLLIKGFVVIDDSHLRQKIKDYSSRDCPYLAAGLPTHDISGSRDANIDHEHLVFFILKKVDYNNRKDGEEVQDYEECFLALNQMLEYLKNRTPCQTFGQYDGTALIDPEYNRAECDGYSLSIKLKST